MKTRNIKEAISTWYCFFTTAVKGRSPKSLEVLGHSNCDLKELESLQLYNWKLYTL